MFWDAMDHGSLLLRVRHGTSRHCLRAVQRVTTQSVWMNILIKGPAAPGTRSERVCEPFLGGCRDRNALLKG